MFNFQKGRGNKAFIIVLLLFISLSCQITNSLTLLNKPARGLIQIKKLVEKKIDNECSEITEFGKILNIT